jgi:hypothetical protein
MRDTVYPLHGAYEDWAYYWGWDRPELMKECAGTQPRVSMQGLVLLIENGPKMPAGGYGSAKYFQEGLEGDYGHAVRVILLVEQAILWLSPVLTITTHGDFSTVRVSCPRAEVQMVL